MATKAKEPDTLRIALAAFYRADGSFQRAENIGKLGMPLDYIDQRTLRAIKAFSEAMTEKRIAA